MHIRKQSVTGAKKKPESVTTYNSTKCGVDILDSMCRKMTTKAATSRWPLAVFCNIMDLTGINAWILYKKALNNNITRRAFLKQLSDELTQEAVEKKLHGGVGCQMTHSQPIVHVDVPFWKLVEHMTGLFVRHRVGPL